MKASRPMERLLQGILACVQARQLFVNRCAKSQIFFFKLFNLFF